MGASSRYWNMWRINPASERVGYKQFLLSIAREFLQDKIANSQPADVQAALLSYFHAKQSAVDTTSRAQAGLCLRCYVSEPILKACQKLDNLFSGDKHFTYRDLLPFVLNDDGETLVILDQDGRNQLIVDDKGEVNPTAYKFFSVKVLQTFKADYQSRMSLDNWTYLQTKQNPELKDFLSEFGFKHLSDWALLNRARLKQLERLSQRDRDLVEIFHAVYRRDRIQQRQLRARKCPDPSNAQLQEMLAYLQKRNVIINTTMELMKQLKQVATLLRQYDIWSSRESLEIKYTETEGYTIRNDLPADSLDETDIEQQEFLQFLQEQLKVALATAIEQEISDRIISLQKSKKYGPLAPQFIPGLQLYYSEGKSLKEIAPLLGMTSWDQARRILNPGELLSKVRVLTVKHLLDSILKKAEEKGLTKIPPEPDYLKTLAEQIEALVDEEIFTEAAEEMRAGKSRSMDSLYAQQLRFYLVQFCISS